MTTTKHYFVRVCVPCVLCCACVCVRVRLGGYYGLPCGFPPDDDVDDEDDDCGGGGGFWAGGAWRPPCVPALVVVRETASSSPATASDTTCTRSDGTPPPAGATVENGTFNVNVRAPSNDAILRTAARPHRPPSPSVATTTTTQYDAALLRW